MNRYPLLITIMMLGLSWGGSLLYPFVSGLDSTGKGVGWLIVVCGIALIVVAAGLFKAKGTTVNPTKAPNKLVTDGIYRVSRNPMYLGMLIILSGFPLVLDFMIGLIFPVIFFQILDRVIIPREEKMVEGVFGESYRVYKSQTRRWI